MVLSRFNSVNYKKQLHFRRYRLYSSLYHCLLLFQILTKGKRKTFERWLTYMPMAAWS